MADESTSTSAPVYGPQEASPPPVAESSAIVVIGNSIHPVDGRSMEVSTDGVAVQVPCPVERVGPVNLSCGAGVSPFDLAAFARVRGSIPLGDGWRAVAEVNGTASAGASVDVATVLGVATPPITQLKGSSLLVGYDPTNKAVKVGITQSF